MSWIRALDDRFDRDVAFFYSVASESQAPYRDQIDAATAAHPTLHSRVVDSGRDGHLTAEQAAAASAA
jgi:predicted ferric reductase